MSYLQLSLLGIPAVIIHGNTLTVEEWSHWFTPAYVWGFWDAKTKHKGTKYATEPKSQEEKMTAPESSDSYDIKFAEARNGQMSLF